MGSMATDFWVGIASSMIATAITVVITWACDRDRVDVWIHKAIRDELGSES